MEVIGEWEGRGTLVTDGCGNRMLWQERSGEIADVLGPVTVGDEHEWIESLDDLGVRVDAKSTRFTVWAPTARQVAVCRYPDAQGAAAAVVPMTRDPRTMILDIKARLAACRIARVDEFADQTLRLLNDPALRARLDATGLEWIELLADSFLNGIGRLQRE